MAGGFLGFTAITKPTEEFDYKKGMVGFTSVTVKRQIFVIPKGAFGFAAITETTIPARIFRRKRKN